MIHNYYKAKQFVLYLKAISIKVISVPWDFEDDLAVSFNHYKFI